MFTNKLTSELLCARAPLLLRVRLASRRRPRRLTCDSAGVRLSAASAAASARCERGAKADGDSDDDDDEEATRLLHLRAPGACICRRRRRRRRHQTDPSRRRSRELVWICSGGGGRRCGEAQKRVAARRLAGEREPRACAQTGAAAHARETQSQPNQSALASASVSLRPRDIGADDDGGESSACQLRAPHTCQQ